MKAFAFIYLLICSLSSFGQLKVDTTYYGKRGETLSGKEAAYFYRIDSTEEGKYGSYSYYTSNNQLRHKEKFLESATPRRETWYYEDGTMMMQGTCKFNNLVDHASIWYNNGKLLGEVEFPDGPEIVITRDFKILQYWDSLGTQLVKNGEGSAEFKFPYLLEGGKGTVAAGRKHGLWRGKVPDGTYEELYVSGKLVRGTMTKNEKAYSYTAVEEIAQPMGGLPDFYKEISRNIRYPKEARKARKQGKVYIEFVVLQNGALSNVRVANGFDPGCDAAAVSAVVISKIRWNPGLQRGAPVKQRMILPITFKL